MTKRVGFGLLRAAGVVVKTPAPRLDVALALRPMGPEACAALGHPQWIRDENDDWLCRCGTPALSCPVEPVDG